MPIRTVADLHEHLQLALSIELSTIPPYLYSMYSIEDRHSDAAGLIRSIAAEEMLHAALVTNILLAVGGKPDFLDPDLIPHYPFTLRHHYPDLVLDLAPASDQLIRSTFLVLEQPDPVGDPPDADEYDSLGQFYAVIEEALERLTRSTPLFGDPQRERQLSNPSFYGAVQFNVESSGDLMLVEDLAGARAALEVIVHQGEGLSDNRWADPSHLEMTHYAKLLEIVEGRSPLGAVKPARLNPREAEYPAHIRSVSNLFNAAYRSMFLVLADLFSASAHKGAHVGRLYGRMTGVLPALAGYLMAQPLGDGTVAGPTFERFDLGAEPEATLSRLAAGVATEHTQLAAALAPLIGGAGSSGR